MTRWRVRLLGGLDVVGEGLEGCTFETRRSALLLARIALSQRPVPRDELADELWPDDFPDATRGRLRQELSRLRRALGPASDIVVSDREFVRLDRSLASTDVERFLDVCERGAPGDKQECLALYRGELLPGHSEEWVVLERQRLQSAFLGLLIGLSEAARSEGDVERSLSLARRALHEDPLHEPAHFAVVRLLAEKGEVAEAVRQYHSLERVLKTELDATPSDALRAYVEDLRLRGQSRSTVVIEARGTPAEPGRAIPALPAPIAPLYGREGELARLQAMLLPGQPAAVRLVTITGPGGMGKTRLAIEAARLLAPDFGGRCWLAGCVDLGAADAIPARILEAVGVEAIGTDDHLVQFSRWLGDEPSLLVLDNLEHLVDGAPRIVKRLLERHPNLHMLATSRQSLNLMGEQEFPLGPLPTPSIPGTDEELLELPGVRLFVERARSVRPDFAPEGESLRALTTLVQKLEGIPLAICLAAARSQVLTPSQMLEQLGSRFEFLVSRQSDVEERHRTLRSTIDWSYEMLDDELRRFFRLLAVFRGGWSYEGARAVSGDPKTLSYLEKLRERSLIIEHESGSAMRFRMLETLREYAMDQSSPEEADSVRAAHGAYFVRLAAEVERHLLTPDQRRWYALLDEELDNIRLALEWAIAHDHPSALQLCSSMWRYWTVRAYQAEGRAWLAQVLATADTGKPSWELAGAQFGAGLLANDQSDRREAVRLFEQSLQTYSELGGWHGEASALLNLSCIRMDEGDLAGARDLQQRALDIWTSHGSKSGVALAKTNMGLCCIGLGETAQAFRLAEDALTTRLELAEPWGIADARIALAQALFEHGERQAAAREGHLAVELFEDIRDHNGMSAAYAFLATLYAESQDWERAVSYLDLCQKVRVRMGDQRGLAWVKSQRGLVGALQGRTAESIELLEEALGEQISLQHRAGALRTLSAYVVWMDKAGDPDGARTLGSSLDRIATEMRVGRTPSERRIHEAVLERIGWCNAANDALHTFEEACQFALIRSWQSRLDDGLASG